MKNFRIYIIILLLFFSAILLSSCIDIKRNIKINADGSGNEKQEINVDKMFYQMIIGLTSAFDSTKSLSIRDSLYNHTDILEGAKANLENNKGLEVVSLNGVTNVDSSSTYYLDYNFDKIEKIGFTTSVNPEKIGQTPENTPELVWNDKGNKIIFTFKYIPSTSDKDSNNLNQGMEFMFANKNMTFNIEFPFEIETTNALSYSGKTAKWILSLQELYSKKDIFLLEATLKK